VSRRALITALVLLVLPATALASWQANGGGSSYSKAASLPGGNTPTANASGRDVTVTWTAAGGSVPLDGYVIKRYADGGSSQTIGANCSGTVSGLTCTETGVPAGAWRYTVTPARGAWRGAESSQSAVVTVSSPGLSLSPTTASCLPETLTGQIQNFIAGQTVSFKLDDPNTGQALTGSITPSPVPSGGTASASVTVPSGTSDGSHTVYAVASGGDVASTPITVNTSGIRVATGSYVGNGTDNRNITGVGFQPDLVIIKGNVSGILPSRVAVIRTSSMPADRTKQLAEDAATFSNGIQSFSADSFQVGNDARVNEDPLIGASPTYYWTAIKSRAGHMALGSYTGSGTSSRAITGLGFSPEYAMVIPGDLGILGLGEQAPVQRMSAMTRTFPFGSGTGSTDAVTSLDSDGFTVGSSATVNSNGGAYYYAGFNQCGGEIKSGSYAGDGTTSHAITGVGFQPDYLIVRANDTATSREGVHRPASVPGSESQLFSNGVNITNGITALGSGGFTVGNNAGTNANGVSYPDLALNDKP
jgi:hypothetical protein